MSEMHVQHDSLIFPSVSYKTHTRTQTLRWHSAQIGTETSQTTIYLVSGRWQSWTTICFLICTRLQRCLPCQQQPGSSISLLCVCLSLCCDRWRASCFLNWETDGYVIHLILSANVGLVKLLALFWENVGEISNCTHCQHPANRWSVRQGCPNMPACSNY